MTISGQRMFKLWFVSSSLLCVLMLLSFIIAKVCFVDNTREASVCSFVRNKCDKRKFMKNCHRRRSCTHKTAKIHRFVRFVMYCLITAVLHWLNEWMNYLLDRITDSQAGTPRHDNCVRLPVSWKPINNWLRS